MRFLTECLHRAGRSFCHDRRLPWFLALLHLGVAAVEAARGLTFDVSPGRHVWDFFWQVIPLEDLLARPWQSLWHIHAQPPGFSLWGLVWLRLGGIANFPKIMQIPNVLMGVAVVLMSWRLALVLTRSRAWAGAAGLIMALNPALFYYEAYLLYEMPVIFLLAGSACCLWRASRTGSKGWLVLFVLALNALVLTRSLYHLVFLMGALAFAWGLWRTIVRPRRLLLIVLALLLPTVWFTKNAVQHGFFGSSSWFGLGLFNCVYEGFDYRELVDQAVQGVIPDLVQARYPFQHRPAEYEEFGFVRQSDVPLLSRNDFHNINIPEISKAYAGASFALILRKPLHYLSAVHQSYTLFCWPTSRFEHLYPPPHQPHLLGTGLCPCFLWPYPGRGIRIPHASGFRLAVLLLFPRADGRWHGFAAA